MKIKNMISFVVSIILTTGTVFADTANIPEENLLIGVCNKNNKCGIVNLKGEEIIPFKYSWIQASPGDFNKQKYFIAAKPKNNHFDGNLDNDLYGIIDNKGNVVVKFQYDFINKVSDEIYEVKHNDKYGYIDINGKERIPLKYMQTEHPSENIVALTKDGEKWGYSDLNGNILTSFVYTRAGSFKNGYAVVEKNEKSGVIDKTGKMVINTKYDYIDIAPNGIFEVVNNNKVGFMNSKGKFISPLIYKSTNANRMFEEGLVSVQDENSKWGFIDENGKTVIPFIYTEARNFVNGIAYVVKDNKSFYIDKTGKEILPVKIDSSDGAKLTEKLKNYDSYIYNNELFYVEKNGFHGVLDKSGNIIVPVEYNNVYFYQNGLFQVTNKDGKYLFYNKDGKLISQTAYEFAFFTGDKYVQVSQKRKKSTYNIFTEYDLDEGLINNCGEIIIPLIYDRLEYYQNGYFIVTKDNKIKLLDINGKTLIDYGKYNAFCTENGVFSKNY